MDKTEDRPMLSVVDSQPKTDIKNVRPTMSTLVGINEAARMTKRSKGQIGQDSNSGKLSFELNERGNKVYQISELERVYGLRKPDEPGQKAIQRPQPQTEQTIEAAVELAVLRERIAAREDALRSERETRVRIEDENRYLRQQNERLTQLLTGPTAPTQPLQRRSFLQWLTGQ